MSAIRRSQVFPLIGGIAMVLATGCGKSAMEVVADNRAAAAPASEAKAPGLVTLGPDAPELRHMTVDTVRDAQVPSDEVSAPARIEVNPNRVGHAVVPVPGRIVHVMVKLGDAVHQGQPVVTIESPVVAEAEAAYIQAEAAVRQAEVAVTKADVDLARVTDLFQHDAVAKKEVLAAQTTAALSKAALEQSHSVREQARRRLELLGLQTGRFQQHVTVTAPVSGKVLDISAVDGEYRNEINTPLVTIADLSRVWVTSEVPESKIRYCKAGGTAELELIAYPNETFRARVTRIADTVNSETRTVKVNAEIENRDGRLRPEMFGRVRYAHGLVAAPWVPDSAVVRVGDRDFVFVEQSRGRFEIRNVQLARHHERGFTIAAGLRAGDRVVTQGSVYLKASL